MLTKKEALAWLTSADAKDLCKAAALKIKDPVIVFTDTDEVTALPIVELLPLVKDLLGADNEIYLLLCSPPSPEFYWALLVGDTAVLFAVPAPKGFLS